MREWIGPAAAILLASAASAFAQAPPKPVADAKLYRVEDGVFEVRQGQSIDLSQNQWLLTFRPDQNRVAVETQGYVALNIAGSGWGMKPGERLDLKTFEATRTDAKGRVKCFLDLIHVAAPKGEPAMGTFRFSCL